MRTYELKPTYNNLFSTYIEDSILRNKDLFYFIKILDTMNDSCSIALNGAWGSGKTFFVKQAKMIQMPIMILLNLDVKHFGIGTELKRDGKKILGKE